MHSQTETQKLVSRIEAGLSVAAIPVAKFCEAARINRATWQRWKAGKHAPHPSMTPGIMGTFDELVRLAAREDAA